MAIRVALHHRTTYNYDRLVSLSPHVVRLRPAPHCRTKILGYSLRIVPEKFFINWQQDPYSNYLARIVVPERTTKFSVDVNLVAEMTVINPFDFFVESYAEKYPFTYDAELQRELAPYLETLPVGPKLKKLVEQVRGSGLRMVDYLVGINQRIWKDTKYLIRLEPGVQTPEETLTTGSGSCRDSAWLQVQLLRNLGLAARFVSGYLIQLKSDEKSLDGPSGPEKDFTDLHAWTEVYVPGAGLIGLDTSIPKDQASTRHIGRDDFIGRRIGVVPGAAYLVDVLCTELNIPPSEVHVMTAGATPEALISGAVDYYGGLRTNQPRILEREGYKNWTFFPMSDIGMRDYFDVSIVTADFYKNEPKVLANYVYALNEAVQYEMAHPEEAAEIAVRYTPEYPVTKEEALWRIKQEIPVIRGDGSEPFLAMKESVIEHQLALLYRFGQIELPDH